MDRPDKEHRLRHPLSGQKRSAGNEKAAEVAQGGFE
jgi:hypothetical protein